MTARFGKVNFVALVWRLVACMLILGGALAVSGCDRKIATHFYRESHRMPRKAEDASTPLETNPDRHAQFLVRAKEGDIDVLFLGDSITDQWPQVGEWSWLKLAHYNPANFGIGGDRTEHLLWRLEHGELQGIAPKLVVLLIGTNNIGHVHDERPEWIAAGIKKIVETIRRELPRSKILLLGIFPRGLPASRQRSSVDAVNREIRQLDDGVQIRFLDLDAQFLDQAGNLRSEIMPDGVHLSAKGYELWYRALEPLLAEMAK
jgi:lysophospholipase L1-like esterase